MVQQLLQQHRVLRYKSPASRFDSDGEETEPGLSSEEWKQRWAADAAANKRCVEHVRGPLLSAANAGNVPLCKYLLRYGDMPDLPHKEMLDKDPLQRWHAFVAAAEGGQISTMRLFRTKGLPKDFTDPVEAAARGGHIAVIQQLLEWYERDRDADGDAWLDCADAALAGAAYGGQQETMQWAIEQGAASYQYASEQALKGKQYDVARTLLQRVEKPRSQWNDAMRYAVEGGQVDIVETLIAKGWLVQIEHLEIAVKQPGASFQVPNEMLAVLLAAAIHSESNWGHYMRHESTECLQALVAAARIAHPDEAMPLSKVPGSSEGVRAACNMLDTKYSLRLVDHTWDQLCILLLDQGARVPEGHYNQERLAVQLGLFNACVEHSLVDLCKALMRRGYLMASRHVQPGACPLVKAAREGKADMCRVLATGGFCTDRLKTVLSDAIKTCDLSQVQMVIKSGALPAAALQDAIALVQSCSQALASMDAELRAAVSGHE